MRIEDSGAPKFFIVEHDRIADAVYVCLDPDVRGRRLRTTRLDSRRLVDTAADGTVLGVELLDVSLGVDLSGLPAADLIGAALRGRGILVLAEAVNPAP